MAEDGLEIIALMGSPRKGGNTEVLLKEAIKGTAQSVRVFDLCEMDISPCVNCGQCESTGVCVTEDDMREVAAAIRRADRIILASPVFFSGVSAQCKAMIDRCQQFWCEKYLLKRSLPEGPRGRKGLFITVGGMKMPKGIECAGVTAKAFFRTVSVAEHDVVAFKGIDAKGAIMEHPEAMRQAFEAGQRLAGK